MQPLTAYCLTCLFIVLAIKCFEHQVAAAASIPAFFREYYMDMSGKAKEKQQGEL